MSAPERAERLCMKRNPHLDVSCQKPEGHDGPHCYRDFMGSVTWSSRTGREKEASDE